MHKACIANLTPFYNVDSFVPFSPGPLPIKTEVASLDPPARDATSRQVSLAVCGGVRKHLPSQLKRILGLSVANSSTQRAAACKLGSRRSLLPGASRGHLAASFATCMFGTHFLLFQKLSSSHVAMGTNCGNIVCEPSNAQGNTCPQNYGSSFARIEVASMDMLQLSALKKHAGTPAHVRALNEMQGHGAVVGMVGSAQLQMSGVSEGVPR